MRVTFVLQPITLERLTTLAPNFAQINVVTFITALHIFVQTASENKVAPLIE